MPQIITSIDARTVHEYTGDVRVTGNIGEGASVTVYGGSLIINGDVEQGCRILVTSQNSLPLISSGGSYTSSSINISIGGINVNGSNTRLTLKVGGLIGNQCSLTINNGDIHTQDVGENTSLKANNGNIESGAIAQHSKLKANNGNITATILGEQT